MVLSKNVRLKQTFTTFRYQINPRGHARVKMKLGGVFMIQLEIPYYGQIPIIKRYPKWTLNFTTTLQTVRNQLKSTFYTGDDTNTSKLWICRPDSGFFGSDIYKLTMLDRFSIEKLNFSCFLALWRVKMKFINHFACILVHFTTQNALKSLLKFPKWWFWFASVLANFVGLGTNCNKPRRFGFDFVKSKTHQNTSNKDSKHHFIPPNTLTME